MKKILLFCLTAIVIQSCGINKQAQQIKALEKCTYKIASADNIYLAGADVKKLLNNGDINITALPGLALGLLRKDIPLKARLNLEIKNPSADAAAINEFEYKILINNQELANGLVKQEVNVKAGGSTIVPVSTEVNIYPFVSNSKVMGEIAEFMKTSANNVDESTVKMLTDPSDLNTGKDIFISTCAACHGKFGEGTVGPNLTDEYWLHGGGVKDIFKTIKYGWPDKGMKSWKEDFSPVQIAQLTSYIRTLKGSNPPKPKDMQGELYIEKDIQADSTSVTTDSTKTIASELPE